GLVEPREHVEKRGLAGAVGANDRNDRLGRDVDRNIVDRNKPSELLHHVLCREDRRPEGRVRRCWRLDRHSGSSSSVAPIPSTSSIRLRRSGSSPCGRSTITITSRKPKMLTWRSVRLKLSPKSPGSELRTSGIR